MFISALSSHVYTLQIFHLSLRWAWGWRWKRDEAVDSMLQSVVSSKQDFTNYSYDLPLFSPLLKALWSANDFPVNSSRTQFFMYTTRVHSLLLLLLRLKTIYQNATLAVSSSRRCLVVTILSAFELTSLCVLDTVELKIVDWNWPQRRDCGLRLRRLQPS